MHSGDATGIVPSSFRILRQLLSRLEDETTGEILLDELARRDPARAPGAGAAQAAEVLGDEVYDKFPFLPRHEADGRAT